MNSAATPETETVAHGVPSAELERARFFMVEQQVRPWDVLDQRILDALLGLRREDFVPEAYRHLAFVDMEIPLGYDVSLWPPRLEGRSFGTNVMEATLLALMDKPQAQVTDADFLDLIRRIPLEPNIEVLN